MRKKKMTLLCIVAAVAFSIAGCSGKAKNEEANVQMEFNEKFPKRGNFPPESFGNMQFAKILEVNGNEITVALAEMLERMEKPENGKISEKAERPERPEGMEAPADMPMPNGSGKPATQFEFGEETMVFTLSDNVEISSMNGEKYEAEDLGVDMVIIYSLGEENQILNIQIMQAK